MLATHLSRRTFIGIQLYKPRNKHVQFRAVPESLCNSGDKFEVWLSLRKWCDKIFLCRLGDIYGLLLSVVSASLSASPKACSEHNPVTISRTDFKLCMHASFNNPNCSTQGSAALPYF
jgi:hypothetical protein